MLSGSGTVISDRPVVDELFGLKLLNVVKLKRTVEYISSMPVRINKVNSSVLCGETNNWEVSHQELAWASAKTSAGVPFETEVFLAKEAQLGTHVLSQR